MTDTLPGTGRVLIAQVRYQLTMLIRTPAAFIFGLVMPAVLLVIEVGHGHVGAARLTAAGHSWVLLTGSRQSPDLGEVCAAIGEPEVLRRARALR